MRLCCFEVYAVSVFRKLAWVLTRAFDLFQGPCPSPGIWREFRKKNFEGNWDVTEPDSNEPPRRYALTTFPSWLGYLQVWCHGKHHQPRLSCTPAPQHGRQWPLQHGICLMEKVEACMFSALTHANVVCKATNVAVTHSLALEFLDEGRLGQLVVVKEGRVGIHFWVGSLVDERASLNNLSIQGINRHENDETCLFIPPLDFRGSWLPRNFGRSAWATVFARGQDVHQRPQCRTTLRLPQLSPTSHIH